MMAHWTPRPLSPVLSFQVRIARALPVTAEVDLVTQPRIGPSCTWSYQRTLSVSYQRPRAWRSVPERNTPGGRRSGTSFGVPIGLKPGVDVERPRPLDRGRLGAERGERARARLALIDLRESLLIA